MLLHFQRSHEQTTGLEVSCDSPATSTTGRLSGWSSICLAIQGPSKCAYHQPFFLFWGSLYWSAGRMNGIRKYLCWRFIATSWCWAAIGGAGFCSAAVGKQKDPTCVKSEDCRRWDRNFCSSLGEVPFGKSSRGKISFNKKPDRKWIKEFLDCGRKLNYLEKTHTDQGWTS